MLNQLTSEGYYHLIKNIYQLILGEIDDSQKPEKIQFFYQIYPKLITMYTFFSLLRGEAFLGVRPHTPEHQNEFYQWEDEIRRKIKESSQKLNPNDPATKFSLEQAKKVFDL